MAARADITPPGARPASFMLRRAHYAAFLYSLTIKHFSRAPLGRRDDEMLRAAADAPGRGPGDYDH